MLPETMRRCGVIMQHNKKHCPAIVGIYFYVDGIRSPKEIAERMNVSISSVWEILNRKLGVTERRSNLSIETIDAIEADYLAGASTYELGEKYGVNPTTISKHMRKRGHFRGKGLGAARDNIDEQKREAGKLIFEQHLKEKYGERFTLVEYVSRAKPFVLRCNTCGCEFSHVAPKKTSNFTCPNCYEKELSERREIQKQKSAEAKKQADAIRSAARAAEYAKDKVCKSCGCVFHSESKNKVYCSATCVRREQHHRKVAADKTKLVARSNHRKRARKYDVAYDPGVTLKKLIERDNNTCQICGKPCDSSDTSWGCSGPYYPSIDHIKPMAKGGSHTWDNVQLAHCICNSYKRDLLEVSA